MTGPGIRPRRRASGAAGVAGACVFLAAVWLALASFPLFIHETGRYEAYWNDAVIGAAIAAVALVRAAKPADTDPLYRVNVVLGLWLVVAPFVWGYASATSRTTWNDIGVGLIVIGLSLVRSPSADDCGAG